MDLFAALAALARRWYLTLPLAFVLVGGTLFAVKQVDPEYKASASVILLASPNPTTLNPWSQLGIPVFADALTKVMSQDTVAQDVANAGGATNYLVTQGPNSGTPLVNLEATSTDARQASKTIQILIDRLRKETAAQQRQRLAPSDSFITISILTGGDAPVALRGNRTRVAVAVGAIGFALVFGLILLIDTALSFREQRRESHDDESVRRTRRREVVPPDPELVPIAPAVTGGGDRRLRSQWADDEREAQIS